MKTLSISELRDSLWRLDDLVCTERELIITRHGKAIARVMPLEVGRTIPPRSDLRRTMPKLASSAGRIREDRDGREAVKI